MRWVLVLLLLGSTKGFSQTASVHQNRYNLDDGVAIKGYDAVAYFSQGKAVKGKRDFSFSYQGITYYFANETDRLAFQADPGKYEPQYGGWCAYAMGHDGSKVEVDPETFKIENGKLYLFYNRFFTNTLKYWDKDEIKLHIQADANWQKIIQH